MTKQQLSRILRNYRSMSPSKFHSFLQRVINGLTDNRNIPESAWAANTTLRSSFLNTSQRYDAVFHQASYGSRLDIAERDLLQSQLIDYLDEIASVLEAAAVRNPEVLLSSGFDLAKERRSHPRSKSPSTSSEDFSKTNAEQPGS